jgi:general secretion pathway protein D
MRAWGQRIAGIVLSLAWFVACQTPPPAGLTPLEQPGNIQAAEPRINAALPVDRTKQRQFEARGTPSAHEITPPPGVAPGGTGDVTLNFVDTDIREIARTILGATLKVNYAIDPSVKGTGSIETSTPLPRAALLPTLETLLNENGATLVETAGVYHVVPIAAAATTNAIPAAGAPGTGTQVIPLRFASAKDLAKLLEPYVAEGGKIAADPAHNAVIVSGDAAVRETLATLVRGFDIDLLVGRSYALFPAGDSDPAKLAGDVEKVLGAESEGPLAGVVRVLPMSRVNAVLVISSQPRYLDAARRFFKLTGQVEDATARVWHVYYVQNGQSTDLELLLQRAFTPGHVSPTPPPPGTTASGAQSATLGGQGFNQGGAGGAGAGGIGGGGGAGGMGGLGGTGGGGGTGGLGAALGTQGRAGGARSPAEAAAIEPLSPETGGGKEAENRIRIIANRRNNALLIYATPSEYSVIEGMLHKIDIIPLQVLIEATIAEVTLNDKLEYGTQFFFKANHLANTLGTISPDFPSVSTFGASGFAGFVLSKAPNFALSALADISQVRVLSAPQVMVLDNEPAKLQVGQRVPVLTGTATSTLTSGAPVVNSVDYRDTGVILQVTPQVNSGGLVTLDIGQEVSNVTTAAQNTVSGSPTFDDRVIHTKVAVQDGQTLGMAGLIQDNDTQENGGLPWIKDIPVLSALTSTQSNSRARQELLVLITPHVVQDQRDARALTEDLRNQLVNAGLVPQQLERQRPSGSPNPNGL